ncbi:hypothetical protein SDC9_88308 [bioreactor metagenome]|uniref:Uncharacterized protein n=1 Tax=bioreactor metagenome TaxID=1076179 RepID=A0A644ZL84_9ZZZZ
MVELFQAPFCPYDFGCKGGKLHEGKALVHAESHSVAEKHPIDGIDLWVINNHLIQFGEKGRMSAVIGPVGIQDLQLGKRGIATLGGEPALDEGKVILIHGKLVLIEQGPQVLLLTKTLETWRKGRSLLVLKEMVGQQF